MEKVIVFDLEMLCDKRKLEYAEKQTIRIGAVKYSPDKREIDRFDTFVQPIGEYVISEFCTSLTGIVQSDVEKADKFPEALSKFLHWMGDLQNAAIYTWGEDDMPRLVADAELHGLNPLVLGLMKDKTTDFQNIFRKKVSYEQMSISNALKLFDQEFEGEKHRPCDDAYNTLRLYFEYDKNAMRNEMMYLQQICFQNELSSDFETWKEKIEENDFSINVDDKVHLYQLVEKSWKLDTTPYLEYIHSHCKVSYMQKIYNYTSSLLKKYQRITSKSIMADKAFIERLSALDKIKGVAYKIYIDMTKHKTDNIHRYMKEIHKKVEKFQLVY